MLLSITGFKGIAPAIAPQGLPQNMAQIAADCRLNGGGITALKNLGTGTAPSKSGTIKSIFKYDSSHWFNWISDVDCCFSPLENDAYDRVYFTGGGSFVPQMTAQAIATSSSDYPSNSYDLGIPKPASAPTIAAAGTPPDPVGDEVQESRIYVYTYVSYYGEEGPPSEPSTMVDIYASTQHIDVSAMSTAPTGSYNIVSKNIYRTNTGTNGTEFQFVATVTVATTDYSDEIASDLLGEVLPTTEWIAPPSDMQGLIALPSGSLAGFSKKTLCVSVPYLPHAWPVSYQLYTEDTIVAIGAFGNNLLVTTTGAPYMVTGAPGSMMLERMEDGYACVSKRSFVDMGYACIYAATNGLMMVGLSSITNLTQKLFTIEEWQAYSPEDLAGYLYDGKYIGFDDTGGSFGIIVDPASGDLTTHTVPATAGWHDKATGDLYLVSGGQIKKWQGGTTARTYTWKSKMFVLPQPASFACAQVLATTYPVTFNYYAAGSLKYTKTVSSGKPFRLPAGFVTTLAEFEVTGTGTVVGINVASSMAELGQV